MAFSSWEQELLKEALNVGVGSAAAAICQLSGAKVDLSIPEIQYGTLLEVTKPIKKASGNRNSAVVVPFSGSFEGKSILIFSNQLKYDFARLMCGFEISVEQLDPLLTDAVSEFGNLVLSSSISSIANLVNEEIVLGVPRFISGTSQIVASGGMQESKCDKKVISMKMGFSIQGSEVNGSFQLILDEKSALAISERLNQSFGEL